MSQDQPATQILVNDVDLTNVSLTTTVELNEDGIPMATITANNEDAMNYLSNLRIGDTVAIRGLKQGATPAAGQGWYNVPQNWTGVPPCFLGTVQKLQPNLNRGGQIVGVIAFGIGYQLKEMRVNEIYGQITPMPLWNNVYNYDDTIPLVSIGSTSGWTGAGHNLGPFLDTTYAPYLNGWKQGSFLVAYVSNGSGGFNSGSVGAFDFGLDPDFNGALFQLAQLHIVATLYNLDGSVGHVAGGVEITAQWTTDPFGTVSPTWHNFTDGAFHNDARSTTFITYGDSTTATGGIQFPDWEINIGYAGGDTYYPPTDYYGTSANGPPSGVDLWVDITPDLPVLNANFRVKFAISAVNAPIRGGVSLNMMYLEYTLTANQGKTVRNLLAGDNYTIGVIPNFVNSVLNGLQDSLGNTIPTGYPAIGTNYIMADETVDTIHLIPSYTAVYNDAFQAVQDIIKYGSGLNLLNGLAGYHWKFDTAGNLLVAPCGGPSSSLHHVQGAAGYYVDAVPNTIPWVSQPYATPIVVKQTMITQAFEQQMPLANFVLVSGKYQYPFNDAICTDPNATANWLYDYTVGAWFGSTNITSGQTDIDAGGVSLTFHCQFAPLGANVLNIYFRELPTDLDFTKLMGRNTTPVATFWFKATDGISQIQFRLYWKNKTTNLPDTTQFLYYSFGNQLQPNQFNPVTVTFPNIKYLKNFNGWSVGQDDGLLNLKHSTNKTIEDIGSVAYWSIAFLATSTTGSPFCEMSKFLFNGQIIRGASDKLSIAGPYTESSAGNNNAPITYTSGFGCRTLTIKNSMANTDTLNMTSTDTSPLSLEALFELQRNRILFITGEIAIEFDPAYLEGQEVWIQAEDTIPVVGSALGTNVVFTGAGNPTIDTGQLTNPEVLNPIVGSYYVNMAVSNLEVWKCTGYYQSGGVYYYTWVDQGYGRYKINRWFRVTKVTHQFAPSSALTKLMLTTDLFSSIPVSTLDAYTTIIRAMNPDYQSHTFGSLKSSGDFDQGLTPIVSDYSAF